MKHATGLKRPSLLLMLPALVAACATVNQNELCRSLAPRADALADALLIDGGEQSVVAGEYFIAGFDAGCGA